MANVTASRAAAARSRADTAARTAGSFGLLQAVIVVLTVATALVHLDKALALHAFGINWSWVPGTFPSGPRPGGALGPGHGSPLGSGHPAGPPRGGGMIPLPLPLSVLFFLNFVGYVVLLVALHVPLGGLAPYQQRFHRLIRWLLIVFTAVTILGYFAIVGSAPNALGEFDKAIEIALIVFLLLEDRYSRVATRLVGG